MDNLKQEMDEAGTFNDFKNSVADGILEMGAFENLRNQEKDYNEQIKHFTEELKKKNDESIAEQTQSQEAIENLKKTANETKTESELQIEYQKRVMDGKIKSMRRAHKMEETKLTDTISAKKDQKDVETLVTKKIIDYFVIKNDDLKDQAEAVDKKKEKKLNEMTEE